MAKNKNKTLIYGCMGLGGEWNSQPITKEDEAKASLTINTALENGITIFDHADIYAHGKAEQVFGKILKKSPGLRDQVKIMSKAGICLNAGRGNSNTYNLSKAYLLKQVEASLKRLTIDCLDIFLLHRPDPLMEPPEVAETFQTMMDRGYAKSFGVSNMSIHQIDLIRKLCDVPIIANQIQFSLNHSLMIENEVYFNRNNAIDNTVSGMMAYSQLHSMEIQAWGSLDQGLYAGETDTTGKKEVIETKKLLKALATKYDTNELAVQLAWIFKLPCGVTPIIGTTDPQRIKQCADSIKIELTREDWYDLWITAKNKSLP